MSFSGVWFKLTSLKVRIYLYMYFKTLLRAKEMKFERLKKKKRRHASLLTSETSSGSRDHSYFVPWPNRTRCPGQGSHSDWKTWKNGKAFSSQGKVREFWWDWKSQGKSHKILENWGNFRQMFFVIFQWQLNEFVYYLLNSIKFSGKKTITEKILENGEKNTGKVREKSGNFVSPEKWEPCLVNVLYLGAKSVPWQAT